MTRLLAAIALATALAAPGALAQEHGEEHPKPPAGAHGEEAKAPEHGEAAAHPKAGAHHGYHPLDLRALTVQFLGFVILAGILARYALPLAADAFKARRERIRDGLATLEREESSLVAGKGDAEKRLKALDAGSIERMEKAVREGTALRDQLVAEGDDAAMKVARKARLEAEIERQKMLLELRNEVVELSFMAAKGVLKEAVDAETQAKLVDRFLDQLDAVAAPGGAGRRA